MGRQNKGIKDKDLARLIKNLSKNLYSARISKGLTQQALASQANMAISTIWELENARVEDFRMSTVTAIAGQLGVDVLTLLS